MKLLNQFDWQKHMEATLKADETIKCPVCGGEGEALTECDCCGHETEGECEECCGDGKLTFGELSRTGLDDFFSRKKYIEAADRDSELLASWMGIDRAPLLIDVGLTVYCSVYSKTEQVISGGRQF